MLFLVSLYIIMADYQEIDISKVIKEKSPKLFKFLPKIVIKKLIRLVHQEEINTILKKLQNKKGMEFIKGGLLELNVK